MIIETIISSKLIKLKSDQKNGYIQEILSGRLHKEVICAPRSKGNFTEYIETE